MRWWTRDKALSFLVAWMLLGGIGFSQSQDRINQDVKVGNLVAPGLMELATFLALSRSQGEKPSGAILDKVDLQDANVRTLTTDIAKAYSAYFLDYLAQKKEYLEKLNRWQQMDEDNRSNQSRPFFQPVPDENLLRSAESAFRSIVAERSRKEHHDELYYFAGETTAFVSPEEAKSYLKRSVKHYRSSKYGALSRLLYAIFVAEEGNPQQAFRATRALMRHRDPLVKAYASYQLGWFQFLAVRENPSALSKVSEKILTLWKRAARNVLVYRQDPAYQFLQEQASRDTMMLLGNLQDSRLALKIATDSALNIDPVLTLERIAYQQIEQNQLADAATTYSVLVRKSASAPTYPQLLVTYLELLEKVPSYSAISQALDTMYRQLGTSKGIWRLRYQDNSTLVAKGTTVYENTLGKYTLLLAEVAKQKRVRELLTKAVDLAKQYANTARNIPANRNHRIAIAKLLQQHGESRLAAKLFRELASSQGSDESRGELLKAALVSLENGGNEKSDSNRPRKNFKHPIPSPRPISTVDLEIIKISQDYIKQAAKGDPYVPARMLVVGQIQYDYGHYQEARSILQQILTGHPESPQAFEALSILLQHYADLKKWEEISNLNTYAVKHRQNIPAKLIKVIVPLLATSNRYLADKTDNVKDAIKILLSMHTSWPRTKEAEQALERALELASQKGTTEDELEVTQIVLQFYPKTKVYGEALFLSADIKFLLGEFEQAAVLGAKFAQTFPKDPRAAQALFDAGRYMLAAGNQDAAARLYLDMLKIFPKERISVTAALEGAKIFVKLGNMDLAKTAYSAIVENTFHKDRAEYIAARAMLKIQQGEIRTGLEPAATEIVDSYKTFSMFERQSVGDSFQQHLYRVLRGFAHKEFDRNGDTQSLRDLLVKQKRLLFLEKYLRHFRAMKDLEYQAKAHVLLSRLWRDLEGNCKLVEELATKKEKGKIRKLAGKAQRLAKEHVNLALKILDDSDHYMTAAADIYRELGEHWREESPGHLQKSLRPIFTQHIIEVPL